MNGSSLCPRPATQCYLYQHMHCCAPGCGTILDAVADLDSPGGIGGYEDAQGRSAVACSQCGDSLFVICASCAQVDARCMDCRAEAAA